MHKYLHLLAAVVLVKVLYAQSFQYDPYKEFCLRSGHQTAVMGDRLYVDGGRIILQNRRGRNFTNTKLLYHDLETLENPYVNATISNGPPLFWDVEKGEQVPSVSGGVLWPDLVNEKMYLFGGETEESSPDDFALWGYDGHYNKWSKVEAENDDGIHRLSYGAGTTVEHLGIAYYLGGFRGKMTDNAWVGEKQISSHFLTYNMVGNYWNNRSGPVDGLGRAEGVLNYIPAGDKGLLVYFGGVSSSDGTEASAKEVPMNQIEIYDVANERWYSQKATGDVPKARRRFCAGAVTASDSSSYNIYLYGGRGFGNETNGFDDVYVLSLPSFRWFHLWPDESKNGARPHYDLSCNVIHDSQMIIIGGIFPLDPDAITCDVPVDAAVHTLHLGMTAHEGKDFWGSYDPALKGYKVPPIIYNAIGGGPEGGAKTKTPEGGFSAYDLSKLFARKATLTDRKPVQRFNKPLEPEKDTSSKKQGLGRIIGSVVGAVVTVIIIICVILVCRRRRKLEDPEPKVENTDSTVNEEPPDYNEYAGGTLIGGTLSPLASHPQYAYAVRQPSILSPVWSYGSATDSSPSTPGYPSVYFHPETGSPDEISRVVSIPRQPVELDSTVEMSSGRMSPQMFQKGGRMWDPNGTHSTAR